MKGKICSNTQLRLFSLIISIIVIFLGLFSRTEALRSFVPLWVGDVLYAMLLYFLVSIVWAKGSRSSRAILTFSLVTLIELLQLVQHGILFELRQFPLGRLVFGEGFLWSDLLSYAVGTSIAVAIDAQWLAALDR